MFDIFNFNINYYLLYFISIKMKIYHIILYSLKLLYIQYYN